MFICLIKKYIIGENKAVKTNYNNHNMIYNNQQKKRIRYGHSHMNKGMKHI